MLNPNEQITLLLEKIKEKENSQDKLDLWLVRHWTKEIEKLEGMVEFKPAIIGSVKKVSEEVIKVWGIEN